MQRQESPYFAKLCREEPPPAQLDCQSVIPDPGHPDYSALQAVLRYHTQLLSANHQHLLATILAGQTPALQPLGSLYSHACSIIQLTSKLINQAALNDESYQAVVAARNNAVYVAYRAKQYFTMKREPRDLVEFVEPDRISVQNAFYSGVGGGALAVLLLATFFFVTQASKIDYYKDQQFKRSFPLFRGLILVSLYGWTSTLLSYLLTLNKISLMVFAKVPTKGLGLPGLVAKNLMFSSLVLGTLIAYLAAKQKIVKLPFRKEYLPLCGWVALVGYIFNPLRMFSPDFRFLMLRQTYQFLISAFTGYHTFLSTFVGEQLTSCIYILKDSAYTICYYTFLKKMTSVKQKENYCYENTKKLGDLYLYLFLYGTKLILCYYDYLHHCPPGKLLFKILKFSSSIVTCLVAYKLKYLPWLFPVWVGCALGTAAAHFAYDIKIDWEEKGRKTSAQFENNLILLNALFRFAYVMTLSPSAVAMLGLPHHLFPLLTAGMEIVRRALWNYVTIQNHHRTLSLNHDVYARLSLRTGMAQAKRKVASLRDSELSLIFCRLKAAPEQRDDFDNDVQAILSWSQQSEQQLAKLKQSLLKDQHHGSHDKHDSYDSHDKHD